MEDLQSVALLVPEIKELLEKKDYGLLKAVLRQCYPIGIADAWKKFNLEEQLQLFKLLPTASALRLFEVLEVEEQQRLFGKLNEENVTPILEGMDSPDLAKIFHKMSPRAVKKMTSLIKRQDALAHIDINLKYPEKTAGSLMHSEFIRLGPRMTARQALTTIHAVARPHHKDHLYSLFVTDDESRVIGSLTIQDLLSSPEDEKLSNLLTSIEGVKVLPQTDQEEVAKLFSKYDLTAVPVVDEAGKLIGILTVKDIISVVRQEATEDIAKMVGTQASDIRERSVFRILRLRMPWLMMTLLAQLLVATVISHFQNTLTQMLALASFLPIVAAMGGNVGSQSAMIMVQLITLGAVNGSGKVQMIFREFRVGLLLGIFYAVLLSGAAYLFFAESFSDKFPIAVAAGVCFSMTFAATMGSIGPLILQRLKVDPATATGPLITTTTDLLSTTFYFIVATLLLKYW